MKRVVMKLVTLLLPFVFTISCTSATKDRGIVARTCGTTPAKSTDLQMFGFTVPKNKILVMRIFASWCPYCKEDLAEIGRHFRNGDYTPETVQVLLMSYKGSRENKATFDNFLRNSLPKFGIPSSAVQVVFVDKDHAELSKSKSASGEPLFTGWQGVPFGLIFGKDGRLAFRGHFTTSPQFQDGHYLFIKELTQESCRSS
jgi:thiol-disulfide isomerase/thioredoxin